ncbi:hypothetical protein HUK80_12695 [Flavobacterium sp. MAH-1]|uniref:Uncharacterized protein n=1 Tax=Flavobacterium agri TaxID=2743471 RepID=A0A7Y8Y3A5_9FLAO|nr:hypothetical protein [Flavobacterium agri]NUY81759.1 hypothetical protein [Flavobacterium agri]NYA71783.1 hypothetical protein [Flavobacterium agri]
MKKCIGFLLAFLVLASNTGLAFSVHYCGDEIASVKPIFLSSEKGCCGKADSKPMGCCKTKIVKSDKEHETIVKTFSFSFEAPFVPSEIVSIPFQISSNFIEKPAASYYCDANAPPLFKLYSQYIFYA